MLIFAVFTEYLNEAAGSSALCLTYTSSAEQMPQSWDEFSPAPVCSWGVGRGVESRPSQKRQQSLHKPS